MELLEDPPRARLKNTTPRKDVIASHTNRDRPNSVRGGVAVVQDPADAEYPAMPQSALNHVEVDYRLPLAALPSLLDALASQLSLSKLEPPIEEVTLMTEQLPGERPIAFTCPECGGALRRSNLGTIVKFDCHIGHSMTSHAMAAGQFAEMEKGLEASVRRMNERIELCRQMIEQANSQGNERQASSWKAALQQTQERARSVNRVLLESWLQPQESEG